MCMEKQFEVDFMLLLIKLKREEWIWDQLRIMRFLGSKVYGIC